MKLVDLFEQAIENPNTGFFIIDSGGYEKDIDFVTYGWHRHSNNKIKSSDVFIYRKPQKMSANGQFYFYGAGQFGEVEGEDAVTGHIINPHPFPEPIMQSDLHSFQWEWKHRGDTWGHYWNQYGINKITKNDFVNLLNLLNDESHDVAIDEEMVRYGAKIAVGDFYVGDELAEVKVRSWQGAWSGRVKDNYGFMCAMCDISTPGFLVGSHIVPVSKDRNNRMNPSNGLCLCVLHDKAFDSGYLAVKAGEIIYAPSLVGESQLMQLLKTSTHKNIRLPKQDAPDEAFLDYHHKFIFKSEEPRRLA